MFNTKNIIIRTAENGCDYTGIKLGKEKDKNTEIIIPRYYMPEIKKPVDSLTKNEKQKIKQLIKAWKKYQTRLKTKNNGELEGEGINFDFDVVFRLIQDFAENGLYIEFEHAEKLSNAGKIDFPKTVKRCRPIILDEGPLYLPYITKAKKVADEDLVRNTQILILNDIAKKIGWLIGFNVHISQFGIKDTNSKVIIQKLKMVKNNSYNTRKLNLVNCLIQYLNMKQLAGNDDNKLFVSVVYKFWEDMISVVAGNVDRLTLKRIFYIRHRYVNKKTGTVYKMRHDLTPLMPDSVYMKDKSIAVLDAKYYEKFSLPSNNDITKQFVYMRKAYGYYGASYEYRNIFIMPTDNNSYFSNKEAVFDVDSRITRKEDLIPIEILYLNVENVVESYVNSLNISASVL